jgi:hypothetical protein
MTYRVVQWGTGNVGQLALQAIIEHPDLELAGVIVHSADKVGRDAGELCGIAPVGVAATDDVDEVLRRQVDCVCYTATGDLRPSEAVNDMCRVLEAGVNVVSTSVVSFVYPPSADPALRDQLQRASVAGAASFFTSGIDPGFANDLLPLTLTGFCQRVDTVRVMEILNYATYDQPEVLFDTMGFGHPLDHTPLLLMPGVLTLAWGGVLNMMAAALDVKFDETREVFERRPAERDLDLAVGPVRKGTMAGLRFEVQGIVNGRPAVIVEHVTRMDDAVAPDWPQPAGEGSYRITVEGSPSMTCELQLVGEDGDHNVGGLVATAMRCLNSIPAVCNAPPGLLSALDLPLVAGRHLMR